MDNQNPVAPITTPDANSLLNMYAQTAAALRGEAQQNNPAIGANPFQSDAGKPDAQKEYLAKQEQYLSPIGSNIFDNSTDYSDDKHETFIKNLSDDPALKEIGDPFHEFLDNLKAAQDRGQISNADAMQLVSEYGQNEIDPILDKHHGKHSSTHKTSLHDTELFIPDVVKRVKGVK
ncbi:hypothetical protein CJH86_05430 [Salmonella enterica]|nr:hypothetical protein [Salmonella enterica]EIL8050635.1 hypothetical protein [Salmonella enterica]